MRTRFRVPLAMTAVVATPLLAAPVAARSSWTTFKHAGTNAFAFIEECAEDPDGTVTCSEESVDVFEGTTRQSGQPTRKGEQVCYGESSNTFDPDTGEGTFQGVFGCTFDAGTLTVDGFTSVRLAPTVIQLTAIECDSETCTEFAGGSTIVDGAWTGVGPMLSQKASSGSMTGIASRSMRTRAASVTLRSKDRSESRTG